MDVSGKVAIVTGGGSGIGLEFVKLLNSKNCHVVIGDVQLIAAAQEFVDKPTNSSAKVLYKKTNVISWKELQELFDFTEKTVGIPDLVCPGAAIFEPKWSSFWEDTEDDHYKTIQVNCEHPVKATRLAIRAFMKGKKKQAVILHISSIAGQTTRLPMPIYCASKAFLNHFVRAFGLLEPEGIRVIAIAPGMVDTPLWHTQNPEKLKSVGSTDNWIKPKEIADIMLQMVEDAAYKGGTILEASGGGKTRQVEVFNDPGSGVYGGTTGSNTVLEDEVFEMMKKERGD